MSAYLTVAAFKAQILPADAIAGLTDPVISEAIAYASGVADGYLRKRYALPITGWSDDLKLAVGSLAQFYLISKRGFRPGSGYDQIVVKRNDDAIAWLRDVSKGLVEIGCTDSTPATDEDGTLADSGSAAPSFAWNGSRGCR